MKRNLVVEQTSEPDANQSYYFNEIYGFFQYLEHHAEKYGDMMNQSKVLGIMHESSEFYEKNAHKYKTPKQVAFQFMKQIFKGNKNLMKFYNGYSNAKAKLEAEGAI